MWEPFEQSIQQLLTNTRVIYDKSQFIKLANAAADEAGGAEFVRKGGLGLELVTGKSWLLPALRADLTVRKEAATQRTIRTQPARHQGLPAEGRLR
jgi:hypothetical protein